MRDEPTARWATPMPHHWRCLFPMGARLVIMFAFRPVLQLPDNPPNEDQIIMSRRILSLVAGLGLFAVATPVAAQSSVERQIRFGVMTGASMPMGDLGDAVNIGWHLGGFGEFRPENFPVTLRGELGYHSFGSDDFQAGGFTAEQEASMIPVVANAIFVLPSESTTRFHLMGGLGMYRFKFESSSNIPGVAGSSSSTDFGINVGGGVSFPLGQAIDVLVEARFHSVFAEGSNANMIPLSVGLRF